jgi:hypothetical protein
LFVRLTIYNTTFFKEVSEMKVILFSQIWFSLTAVVTVAGIICLTNLLAAPISGEFDGSKTLQKAGWKQLEGQAKEEIIDLGDANKAYKVSNVQGNFQHQMVVGKGEDQNLDNVVEICWASTSPTNAGAGGLIIEMGVHKFFFMPTTTGVTGSNQGNMQPFDIKKVQKFKADSLNIYRVEWTADGRKKFRFLVNDVEVYNAISGYIPGDVTNLSLRFEIRNGEQTIDYIRWGLNGAPIPGLTVEPKSKLTTSWASIKAPTG